ncbi:PilZ domain-containing protein [Candidatus Sororendozoicomonas aggregata]|uniref:PilZ domain-containing protein n=1 Tax=Candidatus Sororendozoicomonas aggregata TaxID=3073239 RepID=UPI002ED29A1A
MGMTGFLSLTIKDVVSLYESYMPFVQGGGLFIPTTKKYHLGDEVFIRLTLMDDPDTLPVAGKVVWITPQGAQGRRRAGIGVQFTDVKDTVRAKIETYLAGAVSTDKITSTM